ncbi:serine serine/threonine-protein kinase H1 [Sigmodon hispidus]
MAVASVAWARRRCRRGTAYRAGPASLAGEDAPVSVMGYRTSKVLPEPPKDVQLDLVKKVELFSGTKNDVYKHFITEVDSVGPLKAGFPATSQYALVFPLLVTEPPSEPPCRAKFDPRVTDKYDIKALIGRGSFS